MNRRTCKGQVFVIILLILIGIIVIYTLLSAHFTRVSTAPIVQEVYWEVNGQRVASASIGAEVKAHIVVKANREYVGSIIIKIRKDISFWFDSDYSIKTEPVNLVGGQEIHLELIFTPNQASDCGLFRLRGYFVEVYFSATHTHWVMESSYPPRLRVK